MKIIAVVLTFNNEDSIQICLDSLLKENPGGVIVIDSASTDKTVEIVSQKYKSCTLVMLTQNVGYAKGNNIGIDLALKQNADFVWILNPDTKVYPRTLQELIHIAEKYNHKGIFGPLILQKDKKTIWSTGGELDKKRWTAKLIGYNEKNGRFARSLARLNRTRDDKENDFISGTCMLIPRDALEKGLRFYEEYFMYYEDVEFCLRAKKLGYPSRVVPKAKIIHYEKSEPLLTSPLLKGRKGGVKDYYLARNHLLFIERNAPYQVKLRELIRLPKTMYEHGENHNKQALLGIRDYFFRKFGK